MPVSANQVLAAMLVSSIGFVLLVYGRKLARPPQLVTGIALTVFPYFVSSTVVTLIVGAALLAAMALVVRLGW